jgi:hypothetical protein
MLRHTLRTIAAAAVLAALAACSGNRFLGMGSGPAASEEQVVGMLGFDSYVNDSYLRRQRLLASCENYRTFYNQVERSIRADLPDTSRFVVDIVAVRRNSLQSVSATRSWPRAGRVQATYKLATKGHSPDSVEVKLWRNQNDRSPAQWYVARKGPVGAKLDALGKRALAVTCTRSAAD